VNRPWLAILLVISAVAPACGSAPPSPPDGGLQAFQTVAELTVGVNRFAFALEEADGAPLADARVRADFYSLASGTPQFAGSAWARYEALTAQTPHRHPDGSVHMHAEVRGIYVIPGIRFDRAGPWGAAFSVTGSSGRTRQTGLAFFVLERPATPAVGAPVPAVDTPKARTADGLSEVCTHDPPDHMHQVSVAEALAAHRPFVVVFATPAFCRSRVCGPVLDLVLGVEPRFKDRVEFIHVEPYDLEAARAGRFGLGPAARAFGLPSEPWVFVVGADGRVAAKLEGIFGSQELEAAIRLVAD